MKSDPDVRWQQWFQNFERALSLLEDAFSAKIVVDGQASIDMIDHRNLLSHTYDPVNFEEAVGAIHRRYLPALRQVQRLLASRREG